MVVLGSQKDSRLQKASQDYYEVSHISFRDPYGLEFRTSGVQAVMHRADLGLGAQRLENLSAQEYTSDHVGS